MQFFMFYSGEQILSLKPCLLFYAGDSLMIETDHGIFGIVIVALH